MFYTFFLRRKTGQTNKLFFSTLGLFLLHCDRLSFGCSFKLNLIESSDKTPCLSKPVLFALYKAGKCNPLLVNVIGYRVNKTIKK